VLETSYRYMTDDWGVDSHTLELRYRFNFGAERYLQPHVRFYQQTAADFYRTVLFDGAPLSSYATADHRLGEFDGVTVGLKFGQATTRRRMVGAHRVLHADGQRIPGQRGRRTRGLRPLPRLERVDCAIQL
jgi:hypothetical protein